MTNLQPAPEHDQGRKQEQLQELPGQQAGGGKQAEMRGGLEAGACQQQELSHQQQGDGDHGAAGGLEAARQGEDDAAAFVASFQVVVKEVDGVIHGDAEYYAGDQYRGHVQVNAGGAHDHEDKDEWSQVGQHADDGSRYGTPKNEHDQEYLAEGTQEAAFLAYHQQVFLIREQAAVATDLPGDAGGIDVGQMRLDLFNDGLDGIGAAHVHIEQDAGALIFVVDQLLQILAVVYEQQLAEQFIIVR